MNMEHWAQGVRRPVDSTLRAMDFGTDCHNGAWPGLCNQQHYNGSAAAPAYPLEAIETPLVLLSGAISRVISACISFACVAWAAVLSADLLQGCCSCYYVSFAVKLAAAHSTKLIRLECQSISR